MALVFIGGGARSGKSGFAVRRALEAGPKRVFIATAQAYDEEMEARIAAHRRERSDAFETIEAPLELRAALEAAVEKRPDAIVIDCLTLWMSNLLLDEHPTERIIEQVDRIVAMAQAAPMPVFLVTNEVGMGIVPNAKLGRVFRDLAGSAHQQLANAANEVLFAVMGLMLRIAPGPVEVITSGAPLAGAQHED